MQSQTEGALAQSVEQRTENPCVAGSIPAGTTFQSLSEMKGFLVFKVENRSEYFFNSVLGFEKKNITFAIPKGRCLSSVGRAKD